MINEGRSRSRCIRSHVASPVSWGNYAVWSTTSRSRRKHSPFHAMWHRQHHRARIKPQASPNQVKFHLSLRILSRWSYEWSGVVNECCNCFLLRLRRRACGLNVSLRFPTLRRLASLMPTYRFPKLVFKRPFSWMNFSECCKMIIGRGVEQRRQRKIVTQFAPVHRRNVTAKPQANLAIALNGKNRSQSA